MSSRRVFTREYKLAAIKKIIEQGLTFVEAAREIVLLQVKVERGPFRISYNSTGDSHHAQDS